MVRRCRHSGLGLAEGSPPEKLGEFFAARAGSLERLVRGFDRRRESKAVREATQLAQQIRRLSVEVEARLKEGRRSQEEEAVLAESLTTLVTAAGELIDTVSVLLAADSLLSEDSAFHQQVYESLLAIAARVQPAAASVQRRR